MTLEIKDWMQGICQQAADMMEDEFRTYLPGRFQIGISVADLDSQCIQHMAGALSKGSITPEELFGPVLSLLSEMDASPALLDMTEEEGEDTAREVEKVFSKIRDMFTRRLTGEDEGCRKP